MKDLGQRMNLNDDDECSRLSCLPLKSALHGETLRSPQNFYAPHLLTGAASYTESPKSQPTNAQPFHSHFAGAPRPKLMPRGSSNTASWLGRTVGFRVSHSVCVFRFSALVERYVLAFTIAQRFTS